MFPLQCDEARINHLTLLLVVTMPYALGSCDGQIILKTSSDVFVFNLGLRFEGLLWKRYIFEHQITFEGHWRLQSWTLHLFYRKTPLATLSIRVCRNSKRIIDCIWLTFGSIIGWGLLHHCNLALSERLIFWTVPTSTAHHWTEVGMGYVRSASSMSFEEAGLSFDAQECLSQTSLSLSCPHPTKLSVCFQPWNCRE